MSKSIFGTSISNDTIQTKTKDIKFIVGLDVHKKTTAITVVNKSAEKIVFKRQRLLNKDVIQTIEQFEGDKLVGMEGAYGWKWVNEALKDLSDISFVLLDARKTSGWIKTTGVKSDKLDSEVLAYVLLHGNLNALSVYIPSKEAQENMKLLEIRDKLVSQKTQVVNQLKSITENYGTNPFTGEIKEKSPTIQLIENNLLDQLNFLKIQIKNVENQMNRISDNDEIIKILTSIPGIGFVSSFAFRWKVDNISRFKDSKHLSSYFGLTVRQHQSGDKMIKGKISKAGNSIVRKLFVQGAQCIFNQKLLTVRWYFLNMMKEEEINQGKSRDKHIRLKHKNKKIIAVARKNMVFAYTCWKKNEYFNLDKYIQHKKDLSIKLENQIPYISSSDQYKKASNFGFVIVS